MNISDVVLLPILSRDEVRGCLERADSCQDPDVKKGLGPGFMAEMSVANWLEDNEIPGAYQSCIAQQSRKGPRIGPDLLDLDAKSTDVPTLELAVEKYNLQVSKTCFGSGAAAIFLFVAVVLGRYYGIGWARKEEIECGIDKGTYRQLPSRQLHPMHDLLKRYKSGSL